MTYNNVIQQTYDDPCLALVTVVHGYIHLLLPLRDDIQNWCVNCLLCLTDCVSNHAAQNVSSVSLSFKPGVSRWWDNSHSEGRDGYAGP